MFTPLASYSSLSCHLGTVTSIGLCKRYFWFCITADGHTVWRHRQINVFVIHKITHCVGAQFSNHVVKTPLCSRVIFCVNRIIVVLHTIALSKRVNSISWCCDMIVHNYLFLVLLFHVFSWNSMKFVIFHFDTI